MEFTIQQCKDKGGFTAKLTKPQKLDLSNIAKKNKLLLETPILIVIEKEGEIVIRDYGEILFKDLKDMVRIKEIAKTLFSQGGIK